MPLPEHDVAIVIASDSAECREALRRSIGGAALAAADAQPAAPHRQSRPRQAVSAASRHRRPRYSRDQSVTRAQLSERPDRELPLADVAQARGFPSSFGRAVRMPARARQARRRDAIERYLAERAGAGILRFALRRLRQR